MEQLGPEVINNQDLLEMILKHAHHEQRLQLVHSKPCLALVCRAFSVASRRYRPQALSQLLCEAEAGVIHATAGPGFDMPPEAEVVANQPLVNALHYLRCGFGNNHKRRTFSDAAKAVAALRVDVKAAKERSPFGALPAQLGASFGALKGAGDIKPSLPTIARKVLSSQPFVLVAEPHHTFAVEHSPVAGKAVAWFTGAKLISVEQRTASGRFLRFPDLFPSLTP